MAEETMHEKKPKKHLHSIRTEAVVDHKGKTTGYVSHHTYKAKATDHHAEPEKPMATHNTEEEAGEHVQDQFAQQNAAGGAGGDQGAEEEAQGAAPAAGGGAAEPEAGM